MSFQNLPNELFLSILEQSGSSEFENLILTCQQFYHVVMANPSVLRSHKKHKREYRNLRVINKVAEDDPSDGSVSSTYVFRALNDTTKPGSRLIDYVKVLELTPSDRDWRDIYIDGVGQRQWPLSQEDRDRLFDTGRKLLSSTKPELMDFERFCSSDGPKKALGTHIHRLASICPAVGRAVSEWDSGNCEEAHDHPDSAMLLLLQSLPNLEELVLKEDNGEFIMALSSLFCHIDQATSCRNVPKLPTSLKTLRLKSDRRSYYPFKLLAPVLSSTPSLQELDLSNINDRWISEHKCESWTQFNYLTPDPLPAMSTVIIRRFIGQRGNIATLLSRMPALTKLWLGFAHGDDSARDRVELINILGATVGKSLQELVLTYRCNTGDRDVHRKIQRRRKALDFRPFRQLKRLGLHNGFWDTAKSNRCPFNSSVDEAGIYRYLPQNLGSIYLHEDYMTEQDIYEVLTPFSETKTAATQLANIYIVGGEEQYSNRQTIDVRKLLAEKGVKVLWQEQDLRPWEVVKFFREDCYRVVWRPGMHPFDMM
ncbi:hypothetical protein BT63DRAFT_411873 [Microthyrium microscopicum]|uniref:F-box domain-containing protein n=1 Tax=Microthyrium microscopicum TaxID=703497 RepID=A0A6A6UIR0_9PEZI|nr:hypothetical protein BT63DRAFT_411873 [Microthyrium microscopicum]